MIGTSQAIVGGLSNPEKMPGKAFSLPARVTCPVGNKLAQCAGTVCASCYAYNHGNYRYDVVKNAQRRRYAIVLQAIGDSAKREEWIGAMVELITHYGQKVPFFRWHASGDIFCSDYLDMIIEVIRRTPTVNHWIPTKEHALIRRYSRQLSALPNVVVRLSMSRIGQKPRSNISGNTSTVSANYGHHCDGQARGTCGDCRACWNSEIANIDYPLH